MLCGCSTHRGFGKGKSIALHVSKIVEIRKTVTPGENVMLAPQVVQKVPKAKAAKLPPKAMLKADKEAGNIRLDSETQLSGVPREAWDYRLGTYSALEWILERYKEKKPKDPTIAEKFNTYRFADYKEQVIDLLARVCTVSVETMKIVKEMP